MWLQQKMVMPRAGDPRQQAQSQMMLWFMPLMFAFLTMQFPSGLALYWVVSNIISIIIQYRITGWGGLVAATAKKPEGKDKRYLERITQVEEKPVKYSDVEADVGADVGADISETGEKGGGTGGDYLSRIKMARRLPQRGKSRRPKKR